jgi:octaprenyl-diphosphate synthase
MVEAEAIQLDRRGVFEPSREVYHEVIYGKTASIFEWGMGSGAQLAGASDEISEAMATVGRKIGMAFQVVDDVLDLSVDAETLGKNEWADLKEGKLTWPLIIACERDPGLVEAFREVVEGDLEPTQALRERVLATGCVEEARKYARSLGDDAKAALAKCPGGQARDALEAVIETVVRRGS